MGVAGIDGTAARIAGKQAQTAWLPRRSRRLANQKITKTTEIATVTVLCLQLPHKKPA
jgi:hypothetical protein